MTLSSVLVLYGAVQQYVIEEIMNESLLTAMETYGLVGADGEGSEADINTDIEEMLQVFLSHGQESSILSQIVLSKSVVEARHLAVAVFCVHA